MPSPPAFRLLMCGRMPIRLIAKRSASVAPLSGRRRAVRQPPGPVTLEPLRLGHAVSCDSGDRAAHPAPSPSSDQPGLVLGCAPSRLAHGGEDLELKDPGRSPKIDTFVEGHEPDTDRVQLFEQEHEVTQAPTTRLASAFDPTPEWLESRLSPRLLGLFSTRPIHLGDLLLALAPRHPQHPRPAPQVFSFAPSCDRCNEVTASAITNPSRTENESPIG